MLYYIFDTEELALGAEAYISMIGSAPVTGVNAETGELEPTKQKTTRWSLPIERIDGKWCFPFVGDERLAQFPTEVHNYFDTTFPHTKEEYQADWFPNTEENE